ncbi:hypothetical protein GQ457_03G023730 [Hibiscus cannabinus]
MKKCGLCGQLARLQCESDKANLCWDCDFKVHGPNFLVANHTRTLLCHACQNPTPWLASGQDDEAAEEERIEDAENQVVPWSPESSSSSSLSMSKPVGSLECNSEDDGVGGGFGLKRMRDQQSFCSDVEIGCTSSLVGYGGSSNGEASSMGSSRSLKQPRLVKVNRSARNEEQSETKWRSTAIICYIKRLQKHIIANDDDASATITGICRLSRDQSR